MTRDKVFTYLGFAARSRNLVSGTNTSILLMEKNKVKLLILSEELAENTVKKLLQKCNQYKINYRIFGKSDELSHITGKTGNGVFAITDNHFAKIICEEIDHIQSEREVF